MNDLICRRCQHYTQHYAFHGGRLFEVYCGHCTHMKVKRKKPDAKACEHFTPGTEETDKFATKEYLTKELLQHVLNLALLPPIEESSECSKRSSRG